MKLNRLFAFTLFALIGFTTIVGCRKKEDTIAVVIVKNDANEAVAGATVKLKAEGTQNEPASINTDVFPMTATSNSSGQATFNFNEVYQLGQAGVAVLSIEVVSGSMTGIGVIKIEQEETTEEIVFVH